MTSTALRERIDYAAMQALIDQDVTGPIDALNLVDFADERSYRWYGLMLGPVMLLRGARPVWVGVHHRALLGDKQGDEIVIVRYPSHRSVLRIMTTRYYSVLNRIRERGVRRLGFSLTTAYLGIGAIKRGGFNLVVQFNASADAGHSAVAGIRSILESDAVRLVYASRETMPLDAFRHLEPSDPNPTRFKEMAIFSFVDEHAVMESVDGQTRRELEKTAGELSLQVYRGPTIWEAMPWARAKVGR
jgi:uncharacterized protein (DUF1330 family)